MFQLAAQPQSIRQLFRDGFALWGSGFGVVVPFTLICMIVTHAPPFFFPELNTYDLSPVIQFIKGHPMAFLVFFLVNLVALNSILYRVYMVAKQRPDSFFAAILKAIQKLPYLICATVVATLLILLGLALFFLPGIYLMVLLSMYGPLIMFDDENPILAFKHSWELVQNYWWRTAIILLIPFTVYLSIVYFIDVNTSGLWVFTYPSGGEIWFFHNTLRMVASTLYLPWGFAMTVVLFNDLKLREKTDGNRQV